MQFPSKPYYIPHRTKKNNPEIHKDPHIVQAILTERTVLEAKAGMALAQTQTIDTNGIEQKT